MKIKIELTEQELDDIRFCLFYFARRMDRTFICGIYDEEDRLDRVNELSGKLDKCV